MLRKGSKVGITACSNGFDVSYEPKIRKLCGILEEIGLKPVLSQCIYAKDSVLHGRGEAKAKELMKFFEDPKIEAIFDISGGNLANEVLATLNYETIKNNPKPMFGYSDLTTVLNAIYAKTGVKTYLYQIRNLMYSCGEEQKENFIQSMFYGTESLFTFPVHWIQGNEMEGVVCGGNIRCLLKLAGTEYFPDVQNKILVLEANSGKPDMIVTLFTQLKLMGVFHQIQGILLGTFTELEEMSYEPSVEQLIQEIVGDFNLPIVKTKYIGHGVDSKGIRIGSKITLKKESIK